MIAEFPRPTTNVNWENRKSRQSQEADKSPSECSKSISCDVDGGRKFGQKKRSNKQQQQQQQQLHAERKEEELCHKQGVKDKSSKKKENLAGEEDKKKKQEEREHSKKKQQLQQKQRANNKKKKRHQPPRIIYASLVPSKAKLSLLNQPAAVTSEKQAAITPTIGGPLEQVQQQQQLRVCPIKTRLRFEMLFAEPPPTQGHAPTAHGHDHTADDMPDAPPGGEPVIPMLQDQQNSELMAD
uniref:HDC11179 n=1 Tax=Drosophila melanogaster TaxID=7227 RepID=Q6IKX7_DROME|nr:TPA_inf: HDC11179 [Drosophila melanogaster]